MLITRRTLIANFGFASALTLLPREAFAKYPDRPIRLIVPFAAGGNADIGRAPGWRANFECSRPTSCGRQPRRRRRQSWR